MRRQAQQQLLPAVSPAVITPLSQLTVPASEGLEVLGTLTGSGRGARWSLLDEVYGAFGYNADALRVRMRMHGASQGCCNPAARQPCEPCCHVHCMVRTACCSAPR